MQQGLEFNVIIENQHLMGDERRLFFQGEDVFYLPPSTDMYDLLVQIGIFPSKAQARKNWNKSGQEVPPGFSDFKGIGKLRRRLTVLNPTPENAVIAISE
jgi:hypothetical protein